jgi:hypothetical protein
MPTGMCRITIIDLLHTLSLWSNVYYMSIGSNDCLMTDATIFDWQDAIEGILLVVCTTQGRILLGS